MTDQHNRRLDLQAAAARRLLEPNKAIATRDIIKVAARFVDIDGVSNPAATMMADLKAVIIGDGYADFTGRGDGTYYVANHPLLKGANSGKHKGSQGFLPWFSDDGFQVHHVFAALLLGRIPLGEWYGKFAEKMDLSKGRDEIEWWDIYVYEAFCPIGRAVNDTNYHLLGERVYSTLTGIVRDLQTNPNKFKKTIIDLPPVEYLTGVRVRLRELGFYQGPIKGDFDLPTKQAVIAFQRKYPPLKADGIPGPKTQARLKEVFGA